MMTEFTHCAVAFKEWAVVCEALAQGRQSVILRKGGIDEGEAGFRVKHDNFWLLPTGFHQQPASLVPEAAPILAEVLANRPPENEMRITHWAKVCRVHALGREEAAMNLAGQHIWSADTVRQRFHYRTPGLFALVVRVYAAPRSFTVLNSNHVAGCKSWVDLPQPFPLENLSPVLDDDTHAAHEGAILAAVGK